MLRISEAMLLLKVDDKPSLTLSNFFPAGVTGLLVPAVMPGLAGSLPTGQDTVQQQQHYCHVHRVELLLVIASLSFEDAVSIGGYLGFSCGDIREEQVLGLYAHNQDSAAEELLPMLTEDCSRLASRLLPIAKNRVRAFLTPLQQVPELAPFLAVIPPATLTWLSRKSGPSQSSNAKKRTFTLSACLSHHALLQRLISLLPRESPSHKQALTLSETVGAVADRMRETGWS